MERSFKKEIEALKLGEGEIFRGEGILAVTKALLQSGVSYVGGYQGAPVSHLLDVLVDAEDMMGELGVHLETCTNEAVGRRHARRLDQLSHARRGHLEIDRRHQRRLRRAVEPASPGVKGGALIILGEDYGEGASVIQERSYAYAHEILDLAPGPAAGSADHRRAWSRRASSCPKPRHAPVMMELRIRACHVTGEFAAKDNRRRRHSGLQPIRRAAALRILAASPIRRSTFAQEKLKVEERLPAAQRIHPRAASSTNSSPATSARSASSSRAGSTTALLRALARLGLADTFGATPRADLLPQRGLSAGARGGHGFLRRQARACWWSRKAIPTIIEQPDQRRCCAAPTSDPRPRQGLPADGRRIHLRGDARRARRLPAPRRRPAGVDADAIAGKRAGQLVARKRAAAADRRASCRRGRPASAPAAPSGRCSAPSSWCSARSAPPISAPISAAMPSRTLRALQHGQFHPRLRHEPRQRRRRSGPTSTKRAIAVMGDGGFWHNGIITGVACDLLQQAATACWSIMQNGYTSATGLQYHAVEQRAAAAARRPAWTSSARCEALGVKWLRKVRTYSVATMAADAASEAMKTAEPRG